ncbi:porin [Pusillimonas caeni]|uniref:porin n=1 Tax=Pusillimonas caeni TaxID=1348472 RepID=UPI000E59D837|nr:porin [Pusillimonas caeni]TFL15648.1 porin [Pusillimonas caeni]
MKMLTAIGTCLLAGSVHAQSSVQLSGIIDFGIGYMKSGEHSGWTASGDGYSSSAWELSGSEELGNGNYATFTLGSFFDAATGKLGRMDTDSLFNRSAVVGLRGDWGALDMGKAGTPFAGLLYGTSSFGGSSGFNPLFRLLYAGDSNPLGSSFYDPDVGNVHPIPYDTMWSNSIRYVSPDVNGFVASAIASPGGVPGESSAYRLGGSIVYSDGPLTLGGAVQRLGLAAPITSSYEAETSPLYENGVHSGHQLSWLLAAAYDFDVVKVFGQYAQIHNSALGDKQRARAFSVGASIPLGADELNIGYSRYSQDSGIVPPSTTPGNGSCYAYCGGGQDGVGYVGIPKGSRQSFAVAYLYPLSKRTELYAAYRYEKWDPDSVGFKDLTTHYVTSGIRHSF